MNHFPKTAEYGTRSQIFETSFHQKVWNIQIEVEKRVEAKHTKSTD